MATDDPINDLKGLRQRGDEIRANIQGLIAELEANAAAIQAINDKTQAQAAECPPRDDNNSG